jgi:heme exporter protein CcmD
MDFAAPHTGFVIASYVVSIAGLAAMVLVTVLRDRRLRQKTEELETRRSRKESR